MRKLPHWALTDKNPAFYDTESATAIEQTAKLYGAMQELIEEYNQFVDGVNQNIEAFENGMTSDFEEFKVGLRQEFQDFINVIDLKVSAQDQKIEDAENYMRNNIVSVTSDIVNQAIVNGTIKITEVYNPDTESLDMVVGGEA